MSYFFEGFRGALKRELKRMSDRPIQIIFSVFLPVMMLLFMFYIFNAGMPRDLPVAVCDQDGSRLSREIIRIIDATPAAHVTSHVTTPEEGRVLLKRKKAYALVVIPDDCEKDMLKGTPSPVILYYNNIYLMPASLINRDIRQALTSISGRVKIQNYQKTGIMEAKAVELAAPINIVQHRLFNPYTNYQYYLAGGFMPTVFQIFIVVTCIMAMGFEIKEGTAEEWLDAAKRNTVAALSGKLFPYSICFYIEGIFMVTMLLRYAAIPVRGHITVIFLAMFILVLACQAVAITLTGLISNMRMALSVGTFYTAIAFTFTGLTFPVMAMPAFIRYIGKLIPLTHYLKIFIDQSLRGAPVSSDILSFACLTVFLALPFFVMPKWYYILREERYWYGI